MAEGADPSRGAAEEVEAPAPAIRWLDPGRDRLAVGGNERIDLWQGETCVAAGIFVVRTFPATRPEEYLSVRGWSDSGEEVELGMIRAVAEFDPGTQAVVRKALERWTLVRSIRRVHGVDLAHGYLDCDVETDVGRQRFTMRWTQSQAVDFGIDGKLLVDSDDNRYVIERMSDLPPADRERFLRYVYW